MRDFKSYQDMTAGEEVRFTLEDYMSGKQKVRSILNGKFVPLELYTIIKKEWDGVYIHVYRLHDERMNNRQDFTGKRGDVYYYSLLDEITHRMVHFNPVFLVDAIWIPAGEKTMQIEFIKLKVMDFREKKRFPLGGIAHGNFVTNAMEGGEAIVKLGKAASGLSDSVKGFNVAVEKIEK